MSYLCRPHTGLWCNSAIVPEIVPFTLLLHPKIVCETHQAMLRPYHVISRVTGVLPGGYQVSDGVTGYGWFKTEEEAQRFAESKYTEKG
jgi:hypothetical protein